MTTGESIKVALYDASASGGVCHYTHQLATRLAELGHDVTVLTNQHYELHDLEKNYRVYYLFRPSRLKNWLRVLVRMPKLGRGGSSARSSIAASPGKPPLSGGLRRARLVTAFGRGVWYFLRSRPAIIHFEWPVSHATDYYLVRALSALGFRTLHTVHDLLPQERADDDERRIRGRFYRAVDRIIVHSENHKTVLIEAFDMKAERIDVIPHGSNDLFTADAPGGHAAIRSELGIAHDRRVALFFGIIRPYKGLEYLTEAFRIVRAHVPQATLLIVGAIYEGDPEAHQQYTSLIENLRREPDVHCVNHYVPLEKVGAYFAAADLVVLPYVKTYTSGVLLTAYAAGKAVVATDTGTVRDVVEHGATGFVVPPADVSGLAAAMMEALQNPARLAEMGRRARHVAQARYSWRSIAAATAESYRSTLRLSAPRQALQQV